MQHTVAACFLRLNLIAFALSHTVAIHHRRIAEDSDNSDISAGRFNWIGPEVARAARDESGCGDLPCKNLTEGFTMTNAEIWGTARKPVVSLEVFKWAWELAKLHIKAAVSNSTGPLRKGQVEEEFHRMVLSTEPFQPGDRLLHVKVVRNKVYIIGTSVLDKEPSNNMMSHWSTGLLQAILKILERSRMPDWEAIFTCTSNSYDVIEPFKPGIPIFTHCATGVNASYGVAIPIPRPHALWRLHRINPKQRTEREMQQILQSKTPRAVFRGALSGPWRIGLFQLPNQPEYQPYVDIGMTVVPSGAPCEHESAWCTGDDGPRGWVTKYGLKQGVSLKPADQWNYRYIIIADGVGCPDRLSLHPEFNLASNSIVLWQRSALSEFWFPDLKPWVHYIPLQNNYANIAEVIRTNNGKLEDLTRIVLNAHEYVRTYQNAGAWLQYFHNVLVLYAAHFIDYEIEIPPHAVQVVMTHEGVAPVRR